MARVNDVVFAQRCVTAGQRIKSSQRSCSGNLDYCRVLDDTQQAVERLQSGCSGIRSAQHDVVLLEPNEAHLSHTDTSLLDSLAFSHEVVDKVIGLEPLLLQDEVVQHGLAVFQAQQVQTGFLAAFSQLHRGPAALTRSVFRGKCAYCEGQPDFPGIVIVLIHGQVSSVVLAPHICRRSCVHQPVHQREIHLQLISQLVVAQVNVSAKTPDVGVGHQVFSSKSRFNCVLFCRTDQFVCKVHRSVS